MKQHIEWFEIPPVEGIAIIQMWPRWMMTRRYLSMQLRSVVKWTLRERRCRELAISTSYEEISVAGISAIAKRLRRPTGDLLFVFG